MQGEKLLRTVVLSDAVGFTARMQADEPAALLALAHDHQVFRKFVLAHDGVVVKSTGDGLLCVFESPAQAVRACIASLPEMVEMEHRFAVHTGEVTLTQGDVFGDAVNICARLEREAKPGSVVASKMVLDLVRAQALPIPIRVGKIVVRGVQEPLEIFSWGRKVPRRRFAPRAATKAGLVIAPLVFGYAFWQNRSAQPVSDEQAVRRSVSKMIQNDGSNKEAPDIDAFIDETYAQVMDEVEAYDTVKAEAVRKVDPKSVVDWLGKSPMGQRERGKREIEHWSLAQMAIEKAGSKDLKVVRERLSGADAAGKLALEAFEAEFSKN